MATIKKSLSARRNENGESEVLLRVCLTMNVKHRVKSGVFVDPASFKNGSVVLPRANQKKAEKLRAVEKALDGVCEAITDYCVSVLPSVPTREDLDRVVQFYHHPESAIDDAEEACGFFAAFDAFLKQRELSKNRADAYRSVARSLHRYEMHRSQTSEPGYEISLDDFSADDLRDFQDFYRNEWRLYDEFPDIYLRYPAELRTQHKTHRPQRRGENMVVNVLRKLRAFFNWCVQQGLTSNKPFERFDGMHSEVYGTPFYLTLEERDMLAEHDFSGRPGLAAQRDIFVFQCLVGCRVSDLRKLQKSHVVNGAIEYVAQKTKRISAEVLRVPLNEKAKAILARYADNGEQRLLPFISDQRYNDSIKEMLKLCGIERMVTVVNPTTGEEEQRPICEVASSHMARRTFIGNLYKKVKDPALISSLTGHRQDSRAFQRYREIDEDIKRDLVGLIE